MSRGHCWLCEHSEDDRTKTCHAFAVQHASRVDARAMARSFHEMFQGGAARGAYSATGKRSTRDGSESPARAPRSRDHTPERRGSSSSQSHSPSRSPSPGSTRDPESDSEASEAEERLEGDEAGEPEPDMPSTDEIYAHLSLHVLHPTVRIAHALRGLVELSETLKDLTVTRGEENENPLVDVRTVTMYLKVISEIMQVYRSADPSKMLFGGAEPK